MARSELMGLILGAVHDGDVLEIESIVRQVGDARPEVYSSDIRSALVSLLRRNDLELTDQFKVRRTGNPVPA